MADMRLTLTSPAQGVTLTMYHQNMKDGSFAGDMNFGVGNMTWTGKVDDRTLAGFHVK